MIIYRIENLTALSETAGQFDVSCDICAYLVEDDFLFRTEPESGAVVDVREYTKSGDLYFVGNNVIVFDQRNASEKFSKRYSGITESEILQSIVTDSQSILIGLKKYILGTRIEIMNNQVCIIDKSAADKIADGAVTLDEIKIVRVMAVGHECAAVVQADDRLPEWRASRWRHYMEMYERVGGANPSKLGKGEKKQFEDFPDTGETYEQCYNYVVLAMDWASSCLKAATVTQEAIMAATTIEAVNAVPATVYPAWPISVP